MIEDEKLVPIFLSLLGWQVPSTAIKKTLQIPGQQQQPQEISSSPKLLECIGTKEEARLSLALLLGRKESDLHEKEKFSDDNHFNQEIGKTKNSKKFRKQQHKKRENLSFRKKKDRNIFDFYYSTLPWKEWLTNYNFMLTDYKEQHCLPHFAIPQSIEDSNQSLSPL